MQAYEQFPEKGEYALRPHQYPFYIKVSLLVIIICFVISMFYSRPYISAAVFCRKGDISYKAGNFDQAKTDYLNGLALSPESEDLRIGLAMTCFANKDSTDDKEGLDHLWDVNLTRKEWQNLMYVVPAKYQKYFNSSSLKGDN